jgi:hypothetical protein
MQLECCFTAASSVASNPICVKTVAGYDVDEFKIRKQ